MDKKLFKNQELMLKNEERIKKMFLQLNANPALLAAQIQVIFSFIILPSLLKPRNFSFPFFLKQN